MRPFIRWGIKVVLNRVSVKSKLIMMLLAVSLGSILVIGYLSGRSSRAALTQAAFDHLISVRAAKAHQIETYARNPRRQLEIVAKGGELSGPWCTSTRRLSSSTTS